MEKKRHSKLQEVKYLNVLNAIRKEDLTETKSILQKHRYLIELIDKKGRSLLHYCAENSSALIAEYLLSVFPNLLFIQDNEGHTALHLSVISGNHHLTKYLALKSDINYINNCDNEGHTAVHWAVVCGELECLNILIELGANASTPDIHGAYPSHYAAQMCNPNSGICIGDNVTIGLIILKTLIQSQNVNVNCVDNDKRTPLLWAVSAGKQTLLF